MFAPPEAGTIHEPRRFQHEPKDAEAKMMKNAKVFAASAVVTAALALSACGTTPGDRAVSGGLLGAGAGAAVGSLAGNAGAGAVIGGLGGAAVGAATDPCTLNLGDPFWRDHGGEAEYRRRCGR
jgi:osmotically inducible lipoprotein OsmB